MAAASSSAESESEEVSERAEEKKVTKKESPPKESRERRRRRRRHRSPESRDRGRSARKESGRRRRRHESVPEPANPPKAKKEDEQHEPMEDTKGSGKKPRERTWTCMDCGQKTAPYRAAMDQHRYLNENCLACQVWNRLTRDEQNEPSAWHRCKQEARGKKWGRRSELVDRDGFEEIPEEEEYRGWSSHSVPVPPPAPSRTSWQRDRSEMPPRMPVELKENSPARESSMKKMKKIKKDDRDSSPEKSKKGKKKDRESTSSHDKDRTAGKRRPKQVMININ